MLKLNSWNIVVVVSAFCLAAAVSSPAQTFTSLVSFNGTDGADPWYMTLVQGTDGNLYGTTYGGGANSEGTVFKVTPTGTLTTLYSFCSQASCSDGASPYAGLVLGTDGNFYGTTGSGGANGDGTVFKITSGGTLTVLHSFGGADGSMPVAPLVQATNGNFYGTTRDGGANDTCAGLFGETTCGTIFEITPGGTLTTLHSFAGSPTDGAFPYAGLVQATNGNFYGTTFTAGAYPYDAEQGTVFEITPAGKLTTLYYFCSLPNCADGAEPSAALVQATNGIFYGTTYEPGTVFSITSGGTLTTLATDDMPVAALVQATNGTLYGTTFEGGAYDDGTVFSITSKGTLTTLYSFDGGFPEGGLVQATNGTLYGTTSAGGADNDGTIFSLSVGLGPFVKTVPATGKVGQRVLILGNGLTGSTSVTFNGVAAKPFSVNSTGTAITTTVPSGATTGYVQVTTASGTILTSNVKFRMP